MIALEHVSKKYGAVTALRDFSFEAREGKITGLLGLNGAGKSTALNIMSGFFPPDEGRVSVDGMDMLTESRECKRKIGYLPERPPLYDELTVREYLGFVCDLKEVKKSGRKKHIDGIMSLTGLTGMADRLVGKLSRGFRQRAGLAQALCGNPEILILDEPTVGLDPRQVHEIRSLIQELGKDHAVIFSSHILSEVQQLCSSVFILHEGKLVKSFNMNGEEGEELSLRIVAAGSENEIISALRSIGCVRKVENISAGGGADAELRITCRPRDEKGRAEDQIFHLLSALDTPIRAMIPERNSLEETFLRATAG